MASPCKEPIPHSVFSDVEGSFIAGHGTTIDPQSYNLVRPNVAPGAYLYRLKQVDLDGTEHLSEQHRVVVTGAVASVNDASLPQRFALEQNYPNPFNPATRIRYGVPQTGLVRLAIYNAIGQEISLLVNDVQSPGQYEVTFAPENSSSMSSGTYFCRLQVGERTETRTMFYLK